MGSGTWPLYSEKENQTSDFGRFCIQPLSKDSAHYLAGSLRKALCESLPGAAVAGMRFKLIRENASDPVREAAVLNQAKSWLKELRIISAGCFPLKGGVRLRGPGLVKPSDVRFSTSVQVVSTPSASMELSAGEILELDFVFLWGKGETSANAGDSALPKGWISLERSYSPVRRCNLQSFEIEIGPDRGRNQLLAEITTDGTISPEDAIRRAGNLVKSPPQPRAG